MKERKPSNSVQYNFINVITLYALWHLNYHIEVVVWNGTTFRHGRPFLRHESSQITIIVVNAKSRVIFMSLRDCTM